MATRAVQMHEPAGQMANRRVQMPGSSRRVPGPVVPMHGAAGQTAIRRRQTPGSSVQLPEKAVHLPKTPVQLHG